VSDPIDDLIEKATAKRPGKDRGFLYSEDDVCAVAEAAIKKGALDCNDRWLADTTVEEAAFGTSGGIVAIAKHARRELAQELLQEFGTSTRCRVGTRDATIVEDGFLTKLREIAWEGGPENEEPYFRCEWCHKLVHAVTEDGLCAKCAGEGEPFTNTE
jgi:hypothetical protein